MPAVKSLTTTTNNNPQGADPGGGAARLGGLHPDAPRLPVRPGGPEEARGRQGAGESGRRGRHEAAGGEPGKRSIDSPLPQIPICTVVCDYSNTLGIGKSVTKTDCHYQKNISIHKEVLFREQTTVTVTECHFNCNCM